MPHDNAIAPDHDRAQGLLKRILHMPESEFIEPEALFEPEKGHEVVGSMTAAERAAHTIAKQRLTEMEQRVKELQAGMAHVPEDDRGQLLEEQLFPIFLELRAAGQLMWAMIWERLGHDISSGLRICQGWQIVKKPATDTEKDGDFSWSNFRGQDQLRVMVAGDNLPTDVRRGIEQYLQKNLRMTRGGRLTIVDEEEEEEDNFTAGATSPGSKAVN